MSDETLAIADLRRALTALYLEVPASVARDVEAKAEAVIALATPPVPSGAQRTQEAADALREIVTDCCGWIDALDGHDMPCFRCERILKARRCLVDTPEREGT